MIADATDIADAADKADWAEAVDLGYLDLRLITRLCADSSLLIDDKGHFIVVFVFLRP